MKTIHDGADILMSFAQIDIQIQIPEPLVDTRRDAFLLDACDCYVSFHRSEGFGMGMAEAMALG